MKRKYPWETTTPDTDKSTCNGTKQRSFQEASDSDAALGTMHDHSYSNTQSPKKVIKQLFAEKKKMEKKLKAEI